MINLELNYGKHTQEEWKVIVYKLVTQQLDKIFMSK